jgi:hypothetical protein
MKNSILHLHMNNNNSIDFDLKHLRVISKENLKLILYMEGVPNKEFGIYFNTQEELQKTYVLIFLAWKNYKNYKWYKFY